MHEHDHEIIMALAEGTLDDGAAAAAQVELAGCADCTRDLEMQRLALSIVEQAPDVYLTATESSRLHEGLHHKLTGIESSPAPRKVSMAWGRWVSAAAGAAAVFLIVFMILPMGGGDDDSSDMTTAAADGAANDQVAALERTTAGSAETRAPEAADSLADDTAAYDFESAPETTAAASATTEAASEMTGLEEGGWTDVLPLVGFGDISTEIRQEIIDQLLVDPDGVRLRDELAKSTADDAAACFANLAADLSIPVDSEAIAVGLLAGNDGAERLVVAYVPADVNATIVVVASYPECTTFQILP